MRLEDIDLTNLDRFSAGFPHELFTQLRAEAPIFFHPPTAHTPNGEGFWVLSRHADMVAVASDPETFSSVGASGDDGGGTLLEEVRELLLRSPRGALMGNESALDRGFRIILGAVLLSLIFVGPKTLWGLLGLIPLINGAIGFCPLYRLLGISSCPLPPRDGGAKVA